MKTEVVRKFIRNLREKRTSTLLPYSALRFHMVYAADAADGVELDPTALRFEGKRVVCLVENRANTTIVRNKLRAAADVTFIVSARHETIDRVSQEWNTGSGPKSRVVFVSTGFEFGSAEDREATAATREFYLGFSDFLADTFRADPRLRVFEPYASTFAQYLEPSTFQFAFTYPGIFRREISAARPDLILLILSDGTQFGPYAPLLAEITGDDDSVYVGHTHGEPRQRGRILARLGSIFDADEGVRMGRTIKVSTNGNGGDVRDALARAVVRGDAMIGATVPSAEPEGVRPSGAIATIETDRMAYNLLFRPRLLARLSEFCDVRVFTVAPSANFQKKITKELPSSEDGAGCNELVVCRPRDPDLGAALTRFIMRTSSEWLKPLADLSGFRSLGPVYEAVILPTVLKRLHNAFEYALFLAHEFEARRPAFALAVNGQVPEARLMLDVARGKGIPTFDMQIVAMTDDPRHRTAFEPKADHVFVMDEEYAELFTKWGWNPDGMILNGLPRFDFVRTLDYTIGRHQVRRQFGVDDARTLFVFATQTGHLNHNLQMTEALCRFAAAHQQALIVVKLHPREPIAAIDEYRACIRAHGGERNTIINTDVSIERALCGADFVISAYSLVLLEAAVLRIPALSVNLTGERFEKPRNFGDRACIEYAETPEELSQVLGSALDPDQREQMLARRDAYFEDHPYLVDGASISRIAETIRTVCGLDAEDRT